MTVRNVSSDRRAARVRNRDVGASGHPTQFAAARREEPVDSNLSDVAALHWEAEALADPMVSVEALDGLACSPRAATRRLVAVHPSTAPHTLRLLATDGDELVRVGVAAHPATPMPVLEMLALDGSRRVYYRVLENPSVSNVLLVSAASSDDWAARVSVARNTSLPGEVSLRLANDSESAVVTSLVSNPSVGVPVLRRVAERHPDNAYVQRLVVMRCGEYYG